MAFRFTPLLTKAGFCKIFRHRAGLLRSMSGERFSVRAKKFGRRQKYDGGGYRRYLFNSYLILTFPLKGTRDE